jgi:hypothetical protein
MRIFFCAVIFLLLNFICSAQNDSLSFFRDAPTLNSKRVRVVNTVAAGLYPTTMFGLYQLWYKDFPPETFHTFNDADEWLQVDKVGHVVTAYYIGKVCISAYRWAGMENKTAAWRGAGIGFIYQLTIETFDGFSPRWGFSWSDVASNLAGTAILMSQQLSWKDQRMVLKYSFHNSEFRKYRPNLLGDKFPETSLKDYNGQTYWLSINPASFCRQKNIFPRWLNIAFGYGADGMTGGSSNPDVVDGISIPQFHRHRQYYLSLDVDVTKIKTSIPFLNGFFKVFGFIKIPAPAVEFNAGRSTKYYLLYF